MSKIFPKTEITKQRGRSHCITKKTMHPEHGKKLQHGSDTHKENKYNRIATNTTIRQKDTHVLPMYITMPHARREQQKPQ